MYNRYAVIKCVIAPANLYAVLFRIPRMRFFVEGKVIIREQRGGYVRLGVYLTGSALIGIAFYKYLERGFIRLLSDLSTGFATEFGSKH